MRKNLHQERISGYVEAKGPAGEARYQKNLDYWADRATKNSEVAPRPSRVRWPDEATQHRQARGCARHDDVAEGLAKCRRAYGRQG